MKNLINLALDIIDTTNNYKSNHITFLLRRNTILSIGKNYEDKSHPLASRWGFIDGAIHSELDAIIKATRIDVKLNRCTLWNIRVDRYSKVRIAKPCQRCKQLLFSFNINRVNWTNEQGEWENAN